ERDPARAARELEEVERLAAGALNELRAVIFELRPADLADGLVPSLRKQVEVLDRAHEANVRITADEAVVLPEEHEAVAFRITQEALYNALRHAKARTVRVRLATEDGRAVLEVADDGSGFDASDAAEPQNGLGLASMRERASSIGGELTIEARPGEGTTVRLEVPL